jgi:hypothetical protein
MEASPGALGRNVVRKTLLFLAKEVAGKRGLRGGPDCQECNPSASNSLQAMHCRRCTVRSGEGTGAGECPDDGPADTCTSAERLLSGGNAVRLYE